MHRHTHTQGCAIPYPFSDDSLPFETQPPRCLLCKSSHSHNQTSASLPPWYFHFRLLRKHIIFFKGNFLFTNFKIARSKRAGSIVIWLRLHPQHLCLFVNLCEINNLVNLCCVFFWGGVDFKIWEIFLSSLFSHCQAYLPGDFCCSGCQLWAEHRAVQKEDFRAPLPVFKTWLSPPASYGPLGSHCLTNLDCRARLITGPTLWGWCEGDWHAARAQYM